MYIDTTHLLALTAAQVPIAKKKTMRQQHDAKHPELQTNIKLKKGRIKTCKNTHSKTQRSSTTVEGRERNANEA